MRLLNFQLDDTDAPICLISGTSVVDLHNLFRLSGVTLETVQGRIVMDWTALDPASWGGEDRGEALDWRLVFEGIRRACINRVGKLESHDEAGYLIHMARVSLEPGGMSGAVRKGPILSEKIEGEAWLLLFYFEDGSTIEVDAESARLEARGVVGEPEDRKREGTQVDAHVARDVRGLL